jgi:hypothetical protein
MHAKLFHILFCKVMPFARELERQLHIKVELLTLDLDACTRPEGLCFSLGD